MKMHSDGKFRRTKTIKIRQMAARIRTAQDNHEERGRGHMAPRPITLPPMPWDKKDDAEKRNDGG